MEATSLIIFGATGDLALNKLFPALREIIQGGAFGQGFSIIAIGRRPYNREDFQNLLREKLVGSLDQFLEKVFYYQMDFLRPDTYVGLTDFIEELEEKRGGCNRLFYLAVPPESYPSILSSLHACALPKQSPGHWRRIVVEKPFGRDLISAQELNLHIARLFQEDQVYRIDHYLGKETVQNILAFRFANGIFEPLWNRDHIDHIQITVAETEGIKGRGNYYDQSGAFRDIVQNHILQILALLTMEEPEAFTGQAISASKTKVLQRLGYNPNETVFAQYDGYLEEEKVATRSLTETYAMTSFDLSNERWEGVPLYVRTGKKLAKRVSEVSVQFKTPPERLFKRADPRRSANILTFRIQPDEGISLQLAVKTPRESMEVQPVQMEFCYATAFQTSLPDAYERILLDVLSGERTQILDEATIEASWKVIDQILADKASLPLYTYPVGSWGPKGAEELLEAKGRRWLAHENQICNGIIVNPKLES